jgi:hypothetical protein
MRARRKTFTKLLSAAGISLSAAILALTVVFWFRSYERKEYLDVFITPNHSLGVFTANGRLFWEHTAMIKRHPGKPAWVPLRVSGQSFPRGNGDGPHPSPDVRFLRFAKWHFLFEDDDGLISQYIIGTPAWFVAGVCSLPILFVLRRFLRRRRRVRHGLCVACGYDLRASGSTCPECGTAVAAAGSLSLAAGRAPQMSEPLPN